MNTTASTNIADIYAAPASSPVALKKLFSIPQLGISTFLAVPSGLVLLAVNYRRVGMKLKSNLAILLAPLVTVLAIAVGLVLPAGAPTFLLPLLIALGLKKIAMQDFGDEIASIEANGGRFMNSWIVAGAVIAGLCAIFGIAVGLMKVLNIG